MNRHVWKDIITAYTYRHDPDTGAVTYDRHVLHGCFWTEEFRDEHRRTGTAVIGAVTLLIPYAQAEGVPLAAGPDEHASYLVLGECPYEFTPGVGDDFIREQIRPFEETYQALYKRPNEIIPRCYGSRRMWHTEIRC